MKLLTIETATETCSVALQIDGDVRERFEPIARRQTEHVLPMVESLLFEAGCSLRQLDAIAFSRGPGAFTGVRVAVAVAQGLGYAAGVPLLGISTLATCARAATMTHGPGNWLVALDARMGELYLGVYATEEDGAQHGLIEDMLCAPDNLPALPDVALRGAGSGGVALDALQSAAPGLQQWHPEVGPRATAMLPLALAAWRRGEAVPAEQAQPVYLRNQVIQGAIR